MIFRSPPIRQSDAAAHQIRIFMEEQITSRFAGLLRRRLEIISDHAWRDRDAASHLDALRSVSEEISSLHREHQRSLPARLNHFLQQASFQKALDYIESDAGRAG